MSGKLRISLEQWRALVAVVDAGGYAQAAARLHKTQSAVTYSVQRLQSLLGVKAFELRGRRAELTPTGQLLYRRAQSLLDEADSVELAARTLSAGWEAEIRLAVEVIFPTWLLLEVIDRFGEESPQTRIELIESVMGGTTEALVSGRAHLAIAPQVPTGFLGAPLLQLKVAPVASPDHPLHHLGRALTMRDLRNHRHIVVRDTGSKRNSRTSSLEAKQRWTVSHMATSIHAVRLGYGFSWLSMEKILPELEAGTLKPLPMVEGGDRLAQLYLVYADREAAGPGVLRLGQMLAESVLKACKLRTPTASDAERAAVNPSG